MLTYWVLLMVITTHPDAPPIDGVKLDPIDTQVVKVHTSPDSCHKQIMDNHLTPIHGKDQDVYYTCVTVPIPR